MKRNKNRERLTEISNMAALALTDIIGMLSTRGKMPVETDAFRIILVWIDNGKLMATTNLNTPGIPFEDFKFSSLEVIRIAAQLESLMMMD